MKQCDATHIRRRLRIVHVMALEQPNRVIADGGRQRADEHAVVSTCGQISRRIFIGTALGQAVLRADAPAGRGGTGSAAAIGGMRPTTRTRYRANNQNRLEPAKA